MKTTTTILLLFGTLLFTTCTPVEEYEMGDGTWIDLTHDYSEETLFWPTSDTFKMDTVFVGETDSGFYYESYKFSTAEHGGTHLDAPIHFSEGKRSVEELEVDQLTGQAVVVDVSEQAEANRDYQITPADLTNWEAEHGEIPDGAMLLFYTGLSTYWLVENRNIKAVGLDTPSLDYGQSTLFETHQILFEANIPGFENVANLDRLPATGAYVVALPMKIKNGSGAPLRIVALVKK